MELFTLNAIITYYLIYSNINNFMFFVYVLSGRFESNKTQDLVLTNISNRVNNFI